MVKVRLSRAGAKKNPFYHVIVTDSRNPRDGKRLERIGSYDPKQPVTSAKIDLDRLAYWTGMGAQPSLTVAHLIKRMAIETRAAAKTAAKLIDVAAEGPWAALVGYLAKELVNEPEAVSVTETSSESDPDRVRVEVRVDQKDIGKVVGRDGRTARALRQVVWAAGNKARKRVIVEVLE